MVYCTINNNDQGGICGGVVRIAYSEILLNGEGISISSAGTNDSIIVFSNIQGNEGEAIASYSSYSALVDSNFIEGNNGGSDVNTGLDYRQCDGVTPSNQRSSPVENAGNH